MNLVKRIRQYYALRAAVQAWCEDTSNRLMIRREDARTIAAPPDGYQRFPQAVDVERQRTKALCEIKRRERALADEASEKIRRARLAETDRQQYIALCQIFPSEVARLTHMDQQWFKQRLRALVIENTEQLIEEARQGNPTAIRRVQALIAREDPSDSASYEYNTGLPFPVPADWDDIQARHLKTT